MGIIKSGQSALLKTPTSIVNFHSDATLRGASIEQGDVVKSLLSGALTANTYKALITVSGGGVLDYCAVMTQDITERTVGLKITLDGVDFFSAISAATTTNRDGLIGVGVLYSASGNPVLQTIPFNSSMVISVRSSVGETDKVKLQYLYRTV